MSSNFIGILRRRAQALACQTHALYLSGRDPRTPWYAKAVAACTVAYALSPVDLIPDFIPVMGYLDDLIIVPAGIALASRLIPHDVWQDCCNQAKRPVSRKAGIIAAIMIVVIWAAVAAGLAALIIKHARK